MTPSVRAQGSELGVPDAGRGRDGAGAGVDAVAVARVGEEERGGGVEADLVVLAGLLAAGEGVEAVGGRGPAGGAVAAD